MLNIAFETLLLSVNTPNSVMKNFDFLYSKLHRGHTGVLNWEEIHPLPKNVCKPVDFESETLKQVGVEAISKLAILKLNGGLGTSMGLDGPKSLLPVLNAHTFMDVIVNQMTFLNKSYSVQVPLLFMNSFSTHQATEDYLESVPHVSFMQHQFPRLNAADLLPFKYTEDPKQEWNPPGHGDVFYALYESGCLDNLLAEGIETVFISNSDNLGASFDAGIYGYFLNEKHDFMMELTPKTTEDVKGGTVVDYKGRLTLLERAQVQEDKLSEFENIEKFSLFNTNSLWVSLAELKSKIETGKLQLDLIKNKKKINGQDVIQIETAMGAAISSFENSGVVTVSRSRFLPVKKQSDLDKMRSDKVFYNEQTGQVIFN